MRKVIVYIGLTLDGCFQGPRSWDLGFLQRPSREITAFCLDMERRAGALLLGRKTYEGFASYWPGATGPESVLMNGLPKIVFSRTLTTARWANSRIERGSLATAVPRLTRLPGKDLFVFGSGSLVLSLAEHRLVDEFWLHYYPVVLRRGRPLFRPSRRARPIDLELLEARAFDDESVLLRYRAAVEQPEINRP